MIKAVMIGCFMTQELQLNPTQLLDLQDYHTISLRLMLEMNSGFQFNQVRY